MQEKLVSRATDHEREIEGWARKITEGFEPPRQPGTKPGTYTIGCPRCKEEGVIRSACGFREQCLTCDGEARITFLGQRAGDRELRNTPTVSDALFFTAAAVIVVAFFVGIALWSGAL